MARQKYGVQVDDGVGNRMREIAKQEGISLSALTDRAFIFYLEQVEGEAPALGSTPQEPTDVKTDILRAIQHLKRELKRCSIKYRVSFDTLAVFAIQQLLSSPAKRNPKN